MHWTGVVHLALALALAALLSGSIVLIELARTVRSVPVAIAGMRCRGGTAGRLP